MSYIYMEHPFLMFLDHTQRRTTVGRTALDEWSARHRDFHLTTNNIHNRQTSVFPVGFEPTISADERPQTYALDRAATGISDYKVTVTNLCLNPLNAELNPICYLLALLRAHHFLPFSRIMVKLSTFRLLMSYIYGAPILDVSKSHTTTQHSR